MDARSEERRQQRRESRASQTYREFIKYLARIGSMSEEDAEGAAVATLCMLDQRLTSDEAKNLRAQLPRVLQLLIWRCERHEEVRPRDIGRKEFVQFVAEDLGKPPEQAEPIIRAVFQAVRAQVSAGEVLHVESQLPGDLRDLWRPLM